MGLEALGAIAGGLNRGIDMAQRDRALEDQKRLQEEQMAAWRDDRQEVGRQRSRQIAEQARQDSTNTQLALTPDVGQQYDANSGQGPVLAVQTPVSQARQQAAIYKANQQHEQAGKYAAWADAKEMEQASQAFLAANAAYKGTDTAGYLRHISDSITGDRSPITVDGVEDLGGGRARANVKNRLTGYPMSMEFGSIEEARRAAQAHYSPATYAKWLDRQDARADKIAEEHAKLTPVAPGAKLVTYGADGKPTVVADNSNGMVWSGGFNPDGSPEMIRSNSGGAAGAKGAAAAKPGADMKPYNDAWELVATKGEIKLPPAQIAEGQRVLGNLARSGVPAETAAAISFDVASDPKKARIEIDHSTGRIGRVYQNPNINNGKPVLIDDNAGTAQDLEKQAGGDKAVIKKDVQTMFTKMVNAAPEASRASVQKSYMELASSPEKLDAFLKQQLESGKSPEAVQNLGRQLSLVGAYLPAQAKSAAPSAAAASAADRLRQAPSGISTSRYAGMNQRQMNELDAAEARAFREANKKPAPDQRVVEAAKQQIAQLDAQRAALIKQGRSVEANAKIEEIKKIRQQAGI